MSEAKPQPMRILIAEDNADALESLAILLEQQGHKVLRAPDGQFALEAAHEFAPDVAIIDIGMPRLGGYAVARRIREQDWGRDVFLIAHTSWGAEGDKQKAFDAGFDCHAVKPVPFDILTRLLDRTARTSPFLANLMRPGLARA